MFELKGIIPPLATPFDTSGAILFGDFERNIEKYLEAGVECFLALGSTGESVYLEHAEKLILIETARKRIPESKLLLAGTGVESTQATIELTIEAAERGADAVLVKNPFYFRPAMTFDAYLAHYTAVADASPVPVVIYNIPVFTGIPLESRLVLELAKHENIRGLKDSSGDVQFLSEVVWNSDPRKFNVVAGTAAILLPNMVAGAKGGIVALADASPRAMLMLYRAFMAGEFEKAAAIQKAVAPAASVVTKKYGIPGLKAAMALEGFHPGIPRRPMLPLKPEYGAEIEQIFGRMNNELAELS